MTDSVKVIDVTANRLQDDVIREFVHQGRKELLDILANEKEKNMSWVDIKGKQYLTVATLMQVLRDKFAHSLVLKTDIKHDCEHRVVIEASLYHKSGFFVSSGLAERRKDHTSRNVQLARAVECCQTAAWGRCLKSLFAVGNVVATADEITPEVGHIDMNEQIDKEIN